VLLDPPDACEAGRVCGLLRSLAALGALRAGAFITYEHRENADGGLDGTALTTACSPAALHMVSCKTYGATRIDYLSYR
jgi:hypothetical protein